MMEEIPATSFSFEYTFTVLPSHLDEQQHVNNVVYVQFMQGAAAKHWAANNNDAFKEEINWVVKRHEIDYHFPAFLNDSLLMRTWTGKLSAVTWERHYEIIRPADQKKIITAKSVWVLLNKQTGKPRRIDASIIRIFSQR